MGAKRRTGGPIRASDEIDRELARAALEKRQRGQPPLKTELGALRRWEKAREEELRWSHYRSIPQKHWREMSGRAAQVLAEQAQRYDIPFSGRTIDLPAVVRALHDFLARNARKLAAADDEDPLLAGASSPALERYRDARAKLAVLELEERRRNLLRRDGVHTELERLAAILRTAGETLQRGFGEEARAVLDEALDDWERDLAGWMGDEGTEARRHGGNEATRHKGTER